MVWAQPRVHVWYRSLVLDCCPTGSLLPLVIWLTRGFRRSTPLLDVLSTYALLL